MAHSTWLFLITPSDKIWERTSEPSSVEVILWVWGADLIWPNTCFAYLHYLLQCIQGPQTYQFENNKHLLSHDFCGSEIQEQLSCGWARVAVIWRSPGSGGGRLFLSSLMYMLAGSFSSLLVDLTARFLMTWRDTRGQDRENDQDRSHCVFITWSWTWRAIISAVFYQTPRYNVGGDCARVCGCNWGKSGQQVTMWSLGSLILRENQL